MSKYWTIAVALSIFSAFGCRPAMPPAPTENPVPPLPPVPETAGQTEEPLRRSTETGPASSPPSLPTAEDNVEIAEPAVRICGTSPNGHSVFIDDPPIIKIRQGPGCEYEAFDGIAIKSHPLLFTNVIGKYGDWLSIDLCDDNRGWVFAPAIAPINMDATLEDLVVLAPPTPPPDVQTLSPLIEEADSLEQAHQTLLAFIDHLYNKNYQEAVRIFTGGYGIAINWNSDVDPSDVPTLLMRACEWNGFQCFLRIGQTLQREQRSPMEFYFVVEFINEDGSLYQRRGPDNTEISDFGFQVVKDCDGQFYVADWPLYEQYGP